MAAERKTTFGGFAPWLIKDFIGHSTGLRGVFDAGGDQWRRTKGESGISRGVRTLGGIAVGGIVDFIAPATYKSLAYTRGIERLSIIPALAMDAVNLHISAATAILTLGLGAAHGKLFANAVENTALDLFGKLAGTPESRRRPSAAAHH